MKRVVVMGASGSGKSTLARHLAVDAGVPHIDFDPLFWQPGWRPADRPALLRAVKSATDGAAWFVSGNYLDSAGPVAWARADAIVWLDLPRRVSMGRLVLRVSRQVRSGEELWPGCRQTWATAFRTGLFPYAWKQPEELRRRIRALVPTWEAGGIDVTRLQSTRAVSRFIDSAR